MVSMTEARSEVGQLRVAEIDARLAEIDARLDEVQNQMARLKQQRRELLWERRLYLTGIAVNPNIGSPIESLNLSRRVCMSLKRTGITTIGDVLEMLDHSVDALLAIRNFGEYSLDELITKLTEQGYLVE